MSFSEEPPVETITGFFVLAIFSISSQSFRSELAILRIWMPSSQQRSTDFSSNGVAMRNAAGLPDRLDQRRVVVVGQLRVQRLLDVADVGAVAEILVDEVAHVAELELDGGAHVVEAHHLGEAVMIFSPRATRPRWLFAISSTKRSSKISRSIIDSPPVGTPDASHHSTRSLQPAMSRHPGGRASPTRNRSRAEQSRTRFRPRTPPGSPPRCRPPSG